MTLADIWGCGNLGVQALLRTNTQSQPGETPLGRAVASSPHTCHTPATSSGSSCSLARLLAQGSSLRAALVHSLWGAGLIPTRSRSRRSASQQACKGGIPLGQSARMQPARLIKQIELGIAQVDQ